ncbi:MAG: M56 family metallopeptidase, partial [Candidatus Zixiibacteriota bacterium]
MIESILMSVELASRLALEALLNGLWQGVALTLALWLLLRAIPRMTPSARYLIWSATLAAVIALPFVSAERRASLAQAGANSPVFAENPITQSAAQNSEGVAGGASPPSSDGVLGAAIRLSAPELDVSDNTSAAKPLGLGSLTRSDRDKSDQESGAQDKGAQDNGAQGDQGAKSRDGVRSADVADISRGVEIESADLADSPFSAATLTRSAPGSATLSLTLPGALALTLLAIWFVVSSALLARLWISFYSLRRMVSHSEPLPPDLRERCLWLAGKSRLRRKTRFLRSAEVTMPLAIGLFRPAIVFPGSLIDRLSQTEFDQVTLHELAHLKRFDDWSVLIQR